MKLTQKAKRELTRTLEDLERARAYLHNPRVAVCRYDETATTALHYSRADGSSLYPVAKDYGSELCLLDSGIQKLKRFLNAV